MAEVEFLKQNAEELLESAKDDMRDDRYNSAALNCHQACEL